MTAPAHTAFARILWIQGSPDQAVRVAREGLELAQSTAHSLSLCYALSSMCIVAIWTGDIPEARRLATMLLGQSSQHSLYFWQFWGRCLEFALMHRDGRAKIPHSLLRDPLCSPLLRAANVSTVAT